MIADPNGRNAKQHPAIIVENDEDIRDHDILVGVVASHTAAMRQPRLDSWVEVPFHRGGACPSAFTRETVAVCEWLVKIDKRTLAEGQLGGVVPRRYMFQIREKLKELAEKRQS
jgi:hypothetical protein